jgi:orotate phosphoribosyltransferase
MPIVTGANDRASPSAARERLRQIIQKESLRSGREFRLASGKTSNLFFDLKKTVLDPEGSNLVADAVLDLLKDDRPDFIGGLEMGAVPVVQAICTKSFPEHPIRGFFVRKELKGHGTDQSIEGHIRDGARVVILEDVTTTGGSALKAVAAVEGRGCRVDKVITIVDRLEGARENLAQRGITLVALFTRDDFAG